MTAPLARFYIPTEKTGKQHVIWVEVFADRPTLLAHLEATFPDENWREESPDGPSAAFVNEHNFMPSEAPEQMGTIYYCTDNLDIGTVVHEVVHAAMFIYECDLINRWSRAAKHMTMTNETIAYLIDNFMFALADELLDRGFYSDDAALVPTEAQQ